MGAAGAAAEAEMTMTDHVARLYAATLAVVAFFLSWAVIAAKPWLPEAAADPRVAALERREAGLRRESLRLQRALERRREGVEAPAAPASSVGIVSVPPVTSTRSS
jgi:hypothetical protein